MLFCPSQLRSGWLLDGVHAVWSPQISASPLGAPGSRHVGINWRPYWWVAARYLAVTGGASQSVPIRGGTLQVLMMLGCFALYHSA